MLPWLMVVGKTHLPLCLGGVMSHSHKKCSEISNSDVVCATGLSSRGKL